MHWRRSYMESDNGKKTILFVGSLDTKKDEIFYAKSLAVEKGCNVLLMDTSTKDFMSLDGDVTPLEILAESSVTSEAFEKMPKGERIETMSEVAKNKALKLFAEKKFDGVMTIGGAQNSMMTSKILKTLPYGIPKLLVSTVASGKRTFDTYVGNKDVVLMHSVIDIAGNNSFSRMIINNAVSAMVGMVQGALPLHTEKKVPRVAITLLGITTKGAMHVISGLESLGCEVIAFHANGVGGTSMEELIAEDYFDLILDLNLHEITCEHYGGYCTGAVNRLHAAAGHNIPQIVVPGAIDVLDYTVTEENKGYVLSITKGRQSYFHNSGILHTKITEDEAMNLATIIARRLNKAEGPLKVMLPTLGFCEAGGQGKNLFNQEVDQLFINTLKSQLNASIDAEEIDANINDMSFSNAIIEVSKEMLADKLQLVKKGGCRE